MIALVVPIYGFAYLSVFTFSPYQDTIALPWLLHLNHLNNDNR